MCGKVCIVFIFLCVIKNIWGVPDVEADLKEQSLLYGIALESNNITNCGQELKLFVEGVRRREIWALNILDSSGQEDVGYLFVNAMWMGSKSQCRNINLNQSINKKIFTSPYKAEFQSVLFRHNNTMQEQFRIPNNEYLQIGLCLPKSCSSEEISVLIETTVVKRQLLFLQNYPVKISLLKVKSLSEENNDWIQHSIVIFTLVILFSTLLLTILGSYYDIWINASYSEKYSNENERGLDKLSPKNKLQDESSWWHRMLLCYSLPANVRSLFDTKFKGEDSLPVVHGLKTLGMFYIVFLHFGLYLIFAMDNTRTSIRCMNVWYLQLIYKGIYSVDTYFCLGGFVISYTFYKHHNDKKQYILLESIKVYVQMILYRVNRVFPSYLITIGIVVTLWRYADKTYPLFRLLDHAEETCPTYWWRNLLFINTWYPRSEMCITWTWYISHDMQFYIVNCVLLILSLKFPKTVLIFLKYLVVHSIVNAGWLTYTTSYKHTNDDIMLNEVMYYSFSVRMVSYFVGALSGYYFNKWNGKIPLSNKGYRIGWIICLITFIYVVQGLQYPTHSSQEYIVFYVSFSKFLWSSCIAWLTMACLSGQGGIINKFLSHRCWIPLSKVTFGVYFTNVIVVNMFGYTGENSIHFTIPYMTSLFFGSITVCFLFGTLFSLVIEMPYVKLNKILINSNKNAIKN